MLTTPVHGFVMRLEDLYYSTKGLPTVETIEEFANESRVAREEIGALERRFLTKCGFKYTSNNPGALWLYERQLPDGRTVLVDAATAFIIASAIAEHEHEPERESR